MKGQLCAVFIVTMLTTLFMKCSRSFGGLRRYSFAKRTLKTTSLLKNPFYITTPIYYVNGDPHLGHAYTSVVADVIARFQRKNNREVFFLTGTDEHGQKVEQSAKCARKPTMEFCSDVSGRFKNLISRLNCSNDDFIRTTDSKHKESAKALWKRLEANGDIYLGAYEGWYSVRDECFYPEKDLVNGRAPTGADVEWVKEDSYFFKLSNYTQRLLDYYEANPDFIAPRGRKLEVLQFVQQEGGLRDLSISRTAFMWGIPVPGNDSHVMYVWLDALANYISALDYPAVETDRFKKFWPAAVHIVGKDILRFHTVYWPAFLMAAGLEPPRRVFAHGWWTRDGVKMSKSVGNVIDPFQLLDAYGADYMRYYFASEIWFGSDGDFTYELFCMRINTDLANNIGNLVQRVTTLTGRHCNQRVPEPQLNDADRELLDMCRSLVPRLNELIDEYNMKGVCDVVVDLGHRGNKYFDHEAPWLLAKSNPARLHTVLYVLTELLRCVAVYLDPIIPRSSTRVLDQLGIPEELRTFDSLTSTPLPVGLVMDKAEPVFPKIEVPKVAPLKMKANEQARKVDDISLRSWACQYDSLNDLQLRDKIEEIGNLIRTLKKKDSEKPNKSELLPIVNELNYLKSRMAMKGTVDCNKHVEISN